MRLSSPRRMRPAAARMIASYCPSSSLRSRVSRLPRRLLITSCGYLARSTASRRRLEVPTTAPAGSSSRPAYLLETKASRGFSRAEMTGSAKPSGITMGTSFIECTARWARPSSIATSSSLMNRPLPPISASGRSRIWSPLVVMPRMTTSESGFSAARRSRTWTACHMARRDSREARTILEGADMARRKAVLREGQW